MNAHLPPEWEILLDRIQADLSEFLQQIEVREPSADHVGVTPPRSPEILQQTHSGLDERLVRIEADLNHLDSELGQQEAAAQEAQEAARRLQASLSSFASRAIE